MSTASGFSEMSVSYNGTEVNLEFAIDDVFKQLQNHLNLLQCSLRQLAMIVEQDGDYPESLKYSDEIEDGIDGMVILFKSLKDITSQVCVTPNTPEEKAFLKAHKLARKQMKQNAKIQEIQNEPVPPTN